ncbi:peroxidasin-like [Argopecten irradians]|uniref:peroxidasin-like n=1 Tax=Argopecten irradians TaxID=31199 RepID=UPI0037117EA6
MMLTKYITVLLLACLVGLTNARSDIDKEDKLEIVERIIDFLKEDEKRMGNGNRNSYAYAESLVDEAYGKGVVALEKNHELKARYYFSGNDPLPGESGSAGAVAYTDYTPTHAEELDNMTTIAITALKYILNSQSLSLEDIQTKNAIFIRNLREAWKNKFSEYEVRDCTDEEKTAIYRSIDGSCNNLDHLDWGQSVTARPRFMPAAYSDRFGLSEIRKGENSRDLPSPRLISIVMSRFNGTEETPNDDVRTVALTGFGQFLDHEFTDTALSIGYLGATIECCNLSRAERNQRPECIDIDIPPNDPAFQGRNCIECVRTAGTLSNFQEPGRREQLNDITAYIDASAVYGSEEERAEELWDHMTGKLLEKKAGFPPEDTDAEACVTNFDHFEYYCPKAGDRRSSDISHLTVFHILFLRMHNDLVLKLSDMNPTWDSERLYQETRKIIGAVLQQVTFQEWLPLFIGDDLMRNNNLYPGKRYTYDNTVNSGISNEFSICLRIGHSLVTPVMGRMDSEYQLVEEVINSDAFLDPYLVFNNVVEVARWMSVTPSKSSDRFVNNPFLDSLFANMGVPLDLIAINIQRERELGLRPYADYHEKCQLGQINDWGDLVNHDAETRQKLREAYRTPREVDLFIGGISERKMEGANMGPTFACIFVDQFTRTKFGDRFWFENQNNGVGFTQEQIMAIRNVTLSSIYCRYYNLKQIQENVFKIPDLDSDLRDCFGLPFLDISLWNDNDD